MPKDNIERVLKKPKGARVSNEEIRYEGYGVGGTAFIVEADMITATETASEVRAAFSKFGGSLGETGSVSFMFDKVGQIIFTGTVADAEAMFDAALEAGADNCNQMKKVMSPVHLKILMLCAFCRKPSAPRKKPSLPGLLKIHYRSMKIRQRPC